MLKKLVFSILISVNAFAGISRIAEKPLNIAEVTPIYLSFGRASMLSLPCEIKKYSIGLPDGYKVEIDQKTKRELTITMSGDTPHPSNLLVTCDVYLLVFDLVPNKRSHQASLKVTNLYENRKTAKSKRKIVFER